MDTCELQEEILAILEDEGEITVKDLYRYLKDVCDARFKGYEDLRRTLGRLGLSFKDVYNEKLGAVTTVCYI